MRYVFKGLAFSALALCLASPAIAAGRGAGSGAMPTSPMTTTAPTTPPTSPTPQAKGQPNASCETTPNTPGNSASARGSAFNPAGVAGTKYAGEQDQNNNNPAAVSQYDAACARPTH